jgi:hypothetical protein
MKVTSRQVTFRDFAIFQLKLALDGTKDFVAFWLSIVAITLDFVQGRGKKPRLFYSVVRGSERFDKWLNLHSVVQSMGDGDDEDEMGGTEDALKKEIDRLVRRHDPAKRNLGSGEGGS